MDNTHPDTDPALVNASGAEDQTAEPKPGGLGQDSTIPNAPEGVAAGFTEQPSTFEPEEDEQAPDEAQER